ncbi:MAG: hypothetical protein CME59_00910 [Halioglobus sp.]|nr:hypothetical protein [Halioglobus sp.]
MQAPGTGMDTALARQQSHFARQVLCAPATAAHPASGQGLDVYRRNLRAVAVAALGVSYPTVLRLLGRAEFTALAAQLLRQYPPATGDWGEWGRELPALVRSSQAGRAFPFVAPLARLDWLRHCANRAADARFDPSTLGLLESAELDALGIAVAPQVGLLRSQYPLLELLDWHAQPIAVERELTVTAVPRPVLVYREGLRVRQRYITQAEYGFLQGLRTGRTVGQLLEAPGARALDFPDWLARAIDESIITHFYST